MIALGAIVEWATNDSSISYDLAIMNLQFSSSKSVGDAIVITDSNGNGSLRLSRQAVLRLILSP